MEKPKDQRNEKSTVEMLLDFANRNYYEEHKVEMERVVTRHAYLAPAGSVGLAVCICGTTGSASGA